MPKEIVVSLCDLTGQMVKPWAEAGYECYCVDIQHSIVKERVEGRIHYVYGDVRSWIPPKDTKIVFIAAFPPCTHLAVSGARHFKPKGLGMLSDALTLFNSCIQLCNWSGAPYCVENPVGVLSTHYRKPDYMFDPCDYGDDYTKKTCLWTGNGFRMPRKRRVEPKKGSKMHLLPPSKDRANLRSATPKGFAEAVFKTNNPRRKNVKIWKPQIRRRHSNF